MSRGGDGLRTIVVLPYDPNWAIEFERIKLEIMNAVKEKEYVLAVEHIGSTSVPGLYAKPIIDIDIVIDITVFGKVAEKLGSIGYTHVGNLGVDGREAFKYAEKPHLMEHHLYACDKDADELKRHLVLRDFLRNNKEYREKYSRIKLEMARKYPHDIDAYIDGKQPLILEIYEKCGLDISYKKFFKDIQ